MIRSLDISSNLSPTDGAANVAYLRTLPAIGGDIVFYGDYPLSIPANQSIDFGWNGSFSSDGSSRFLVQVDRSVNGANYHGLFRLNRGHNWEGNVNFTMSGFGIECTQDLLDEDNANPGLGWQQYPAVYIRSHASIEGGPYSGDIKFESMSIKGFSHGILGTASWSDGLNINVKNSFVSGITSIAYFGTSQNNCLILEDSDVETRAYQNGHGQGVYKHANIAMRISRCLFTSNHYFPDIYQKTAIQSHGSANDERPLMSIVEDCVMSSDFGFLSNGGILFNTLSPASGQHVVRNCRIKCKDTAIPTRDGILLDGCRIEGTRGVQGYNTNTADRTGVLYEIKRSSIEASSAAIECSGVGSIWIMDGSTAKLVYSPTGTIGRAAIRTEGSNVIGAFYATNSDIDARPIGPNYPLSAIELNGECHIYGTSVTVTCSNSAFANGAHAGSVDGLSLIDYTPIGLPDPLFGTQWIEGRYLVIGDK